MTNMEAATATTTTSTTTVTTHHAAAHHAPVPRPSAHLPLPVPDRLPPSQPPPPFLVRKRIAVLGARGVGKSALAIRCVFNRFESDYLQTFQDVYRWQPVIDGTRYDVSIDDTDGQDEHSEFGLRYTTGVDAYILIFSVHDFDSFEVVKALNDKLLDTLDIMKRKGVAELPRVLVGSQIDIAQPRKVPKHYAQAWADGEGIPYMESSAYTPCNVDEPFIAVLRIINQNLQDAHNTPFNLRETDNEAPPKPPNNSCCVQ